METIEKLFLVGSHRYSFAAGEPCEIVGVAMITPEGLDPRACFRIITQGGEEDFVPMHDSDNFILVSETNVKEGKIPEVVS